MRVTSSSFQNIQYLLEKTLTQLTQANAAQNAATSGTSGQNDAVVSKKVGTNTLVEKSGDKLTIYSVTKDGKKVKMQEMDANSDNGKSLVSTLKLGTTAKTKTDGDQAAKDAADEIMKSKSSMSLVDYLA